MGHFHPYLDSEHTSPLLQIAKHPSLVLKLEVFKHDKDSLILFDASTQTCERILGS